MQIFEAIMAVVGAIAVICALCYIAFVWSLDSNSDAWK